MLPIKVHYNLDRALLALNYLHKSKLNYRVKIAPTHIEFNVFIDSRMFLEHEKVSRNLAELKTLPIQIV